jgi:hypothetical protein
VEQIADEILKEISIIKWSLVCMTVLLWGIAVSKLLEKVTSSIEKKKNKKKITGFSKD